GRDVVTFFVAFDNDVKLARHEYVLALYSNRLAKSLLGEAKFVANNRVFSAKTGNIPSDKDFKAIQSASVLLWHVCRPPL
ncbi:MAG: hypothetical protein WA213_06865, partial [Terriglobales bacterium]